MTKTAYALTREKPDTMTKYSRKRKRSSIRRNIRTDWISNLPDEILVSIISQLPVHELLATSCLSRRWRNLWTSVPCLDFHLSEEPRPEVILSSVLAGRNNSSRLNVCRIRHINNEKAADLHIWIPYLTSMSISKLILHCRPPPFTFDPYQILTIPSLQELYLTDFEFLPRGPPISGISLLSTLILTGVSFCDHWDLNTLIDSAPLLERLTLSNCRFFGTSNSIRIFAQYLKLLEIDRMDFCLLDLDAPVLTTLRLNDLGCLDDVAVTAPSLLFLNTSDTVDEEIENNIADLAQEIRDGLADQEIDDLDQEIQDGLADQEIDDLAQEIQDGLADQEIEQDFVPPPLTWINREPNLSSSIQTLDLFNKVPDSPYHASFFMGLRKLFIGIKPSDSDHYSVLISVLENCTHLRELGIVIHPDRMFNRFRACMSSGYLPRLRGNIVLKHFDCLDHHLEHLWIKGYTLPVLEVVRLILWKSVALKRLVVSHSDSTSAAQVMKTLKFLLPSASEVDITIKPE